MLYTLKYDMNTGISYLYVYRAILSAYVRIQILYMHLYNIHTGIRRVEYYTALTYLQIALPEARLHDLALLRGQAGVVVGDTI